MIIKPIHKNDDNFWGSLLKKHLFTAKTKYFRNVCVGLKLSETSIYRENEIYSRDIMALVTYSNDVIADIVTQ